MPTSIDWTKSAAADFGDTAVRTPVTVTVNNITGHNEYSDGSTNNVTIVLENANRKYSFTESGLTQGADARAFVIGNETINKNDKIAINSITYRVDTVSTRYFSSNAIFKTLLLFEL